MRRVTVTPNSPLLSGRLGWTAQPRALHQVRRSPPARLHPPRSLLRARLLAHLIAMAHSVGIELTLDDFQAVSDRVPFIADLKPSGKYVMEDVHKIGGTPGVLKVKSRTRPKRVVRARTTSRPARRSRPHALGRNPGGRDETIGFPFNSLRAMPINPFNSPDLSRRTEHGDAARRFSRARKT